MNKSLLDTDTLSEIGKGKHAGIAVDGNKFEIVDLGSKNGVLVNGKKTPRRFLRNGRLDLDWNRKRSTEYFARLRTTSRGFFLHAPEGVVGGGAGLGLALVAVLVDPGRPLGVKI